MSADPALDRVRVAYVQKIDEGLAVLYALALLHTWNAPTDRRAFELGMILMQKNDLRQRIVKRQSTTQSVPVRNPPVSPSIGRIDEFIGELVGTNTITVTNRKTRQVIALGTKAPRKADLMKESVGANAFMMAAEAVQAVTVLNEIGQSLDHYLTADDHDAIEIAIS